MKVIPIAGYALYIAFPKVPFDLVIEGDGSFQVMMHVTVYALPVTDTDHGGLEHSCLILDTRIPVCPEYLLNAIAEAKTPLALGNVGRDSPATSILASQNPVLRRVPGPVPVASGRGKSLNARLFVMSTRMLY